MDPKSCVVDHSNPLSKGGEDTLENKQPARRDCNLAKSSRVVPPTMRRSGTLSRGSEDVA